MHATKFREGKHQLGPVSMKWLVTNPLLEIVPWWKTPTTGKITFGIWEAEQTAEADFDNCDGVTVLKAGRKNKS